MGGEEGVGDSKEGEKKRIVRSLRCTYEKRRRYIYIYVSGLYILSCRREK